jgi:hypothetical protein
MSNPDLDKLLVDEAAKVAAMTPEERSEYLDQIVAMQRANTKPYTEGERQARAMRPKPTPAEEEMVQAAYDAMADRRMDKNPTLEGAELLVSVDVYLNEDSTELRATATDADGRDIYADHKQFVDHILRRSVWLFTRGGKLHSNEGRSIYNITMYEGGRVTTRWDIQWLDKLLQQGAKP